MSDSTWTPKNMNIETTKAEFSTTPPAMVTDTLERLRSLLAFMEKKNAPAQGIADLRLAIDALAMHQENGDMVERAQAAILDKLKAMHATNGAAGGVDGSVWVGGALVDIKALADAAIASLIAG